MKYKKIWSKKKLKLEIKIKLYDALVLSLMLHNSSCWASTKVVLEKVNTCHRKHLRRIVNIKWPKTISNQKLYDMTNSKPLDERIECSRIRLFENILTSEENSPAYTSLIFAVANHDNFNSRKGRPRSNLLTLLRKDMNDRNLTLDNNSDIENLKELILKEGHLPDKKSATMVTSNRKETPGHRTKNPRKSLLPIGGERAANMASFCGH